MSFLLRDNSGFNSRKRSQPKTLKTLLVVFIFVLVILLLNVFHPDFLSGFLQRIGRPFWLVENSVSQDLAGFSSYFASKQILESENAALQSQLTSQNLELQNEAALQEENENLKDVLGRTNQKNLLLANVLQGPPFSPYDTFILDAGATTGIQVGDAVLIDGILPIGTITELYQTTSAASLYSSPGVQTSVVVGDKSAIFTAIGRGDGNFEVTVPGALAQSLTSSTSTQIFLPGIPDETIGSIDGGTANVAQNTQTFYFGSGFNVEQTRQVYVELSSN